MFEKKLFSARIKMDLSGFKKSFKEKQKNIELFQSTDSQVISGTSPFKEEPSTVWEIDSKHDHS